MFAYYIPLLVSVAFASHGHKKGSLSSSGAAAAFVVGYGHLANPLKVFGVALIFFYLAGSRATKVKIHVKEKLEDGPTPLRPGGNRSAIQVVSNCLPSLLAALYFRFQLPTTLNTFGCPVTSPAPKRLVYIAVAQLATNFGDTLASELGILSHAPPRYILTGKAVPPGTNGAVSPFGLLVSALGGTAIGLVAILDIALERSKCRATSWSWAVELILFATGSGFIGSLIDTLLGATLQETLYSTKDKRILTDLSHRPHEKLERIGIGRPVLTNSAVNFLSGLVMAGLAYLYAS